MRPRWLLLPLVLLALAIGVWLLRRPAAAPAEPAGAGTKLFAQVFDKVKKTAVDPLEDQELYRRAAAGMIEELDDPYAVLLLPGEEPPPPEDVPVGPGLYLDRRDGLVVIVAVVPGSPAAAGGARAGDRLLGVDSTVVDAGRLDRLVPLLEGTPGSTLTLRLRRAGTRGQLALKVARGSVPGVPALESALLAGGVARIRVAHFAAGIADSVRNRLEQLRGQGARALILDLRATVGGKLDQGVALADLFLEKGTTIAVSRGRASMASARYQDSAGSAFAPMPLAVLVDAGTAGAAEVVAGALQDHDRAAVLGSNSFGRGVTQSTFPLGAGASLRLTTSLWITPNGRQIQRPPRPATGDTLPRPRVKSDGGRVLVGGGGIVPDREIADTGQQDLVMAEARRVLMGASSPAEVLASLGHREP
jgi:carboxyl-terminal processing protease